MAEEHHVSLKVTCAHRNFSEAPTFRGTIHNRLRVLTLFEIVSRGQTRPHAMERQEIKG